jgi:predicted dehydrogenase
MAACTAKGANMSNIRLGIIGCGIMGERILRVALENSDLGVSVSGVYEPSSERRALLAKDFPSVALPTSREDLIADSDCIYIASPPLTHLDHARASMVEGCAVLTEKPLSVSIGESEAFRELARLEGSRTAVNFIFSSSPAAQQVQRWVSDGTVGIAERVDIKLAFSNWPRDWQEGASSWLSGPEEGGFTREVASHFLFLTGRAFGPATLISAVTRYDSPGTSEAAINADLEAGGLPVNLTGAVGATDQSDHNIWQVTGSRGKVRLRDWSFAERWDEASGSWLGDPDAPPHAEMRPIILRGQVGKLPALVRNEPTDLASVSEALDVQRVVEAILSGRN